ncbi:MAG: riboflavin synthase [Planctomycetota bacterium]
MFTGLVEALGEVRDIAADGPGSRLTIAQPQLASASKLGDSVAINGVCLTVVAADDGAFAFQAGPETLRRTNLGELTVGCRVNLERALAVGDRLGGHIVQGHVDGVGTIARRERQGDWEVIWFACPAELNRYLVSKGSITVDGVSLTVVDVTADAFSVALIPHTLAATTLGFKTPAATVNLETDLIAKHLVRYLDGLDWSRVRQPG